jgi:hypothetical protein
MKGCNPPPSNHHPFQTRAWWEVPHDHHWRSSEEFLVNRPFHDESFYTVFEVICVRMCSIVSATNYAPRCWDLVTERCYLRFMEYWFASMASSWCRKATSLVVFGLMGVTGTGIYDDYLIFKQCSTYDHVTAFLFQYSSMERIVAWNIQFLLSGGARHIFVFLKWTRNIWTLLN